ncbi:hypothetical protein [Polycyclovorans algicola]|uniref:hypothetical protein n=1 Tax=Polycyclovorans algicola TaxID=616992 RepID=UPI00190F4673|nr:hypothetical protein [Polycyclovorans algicola]
MREDSDHRGITRREVMLGIGGLGALALPAGPLWGAPPAAAANKVPLPSPDTIRHDYQRMVDFGPRLPGHPNHLRFVDMLAREFEALGLTLGPCQHYPYTRWDPLAYGLEVEDGGAFKPVPKVAYYVRSASTPAEGITASLVYGGTLVKSGPTHLGEVPKGSIVVFDAVLPPTTLRKLANPHHLHVPEAQRDDYLDRPYKRLWMTPPFAIEAALARGAAAVIIIMDVSSDMIQDNFSPHSNPYQPPLPALFVGQDTGEAIRRLAKRGARARLTLHAQWNASNVPSLTAILPGSSDEVMIINTHTDGQNFIEENGCMTLVQLARHFASLSGDERLRRTLVFVGWPGHMTGVLPECEGWCRDHPDLMKRAAAAFTIEHLGAPEWEDIPGKGYGPTGRNEYMNFATTGGVLTDYVKEGFAKFDLREHGIQHGPGITTGSIFHESGVPHVGVIGGPNYLLGVVADGHMDKLDADLAARQTAMLAELIKRADRVPAAQLRAGDKTLGLDENASKHKLDAELAVLRTKPPDDSILGPCLASDG